MGSSEIGGSIISAHVGKVSLKMHSGHLRWYWVYFNRSKLKTPQNFLGKYRAEIVSFPYLLGWGGARAKGGFDF